ncbi:IQCH protein, partial [Climacteris rufus]|nr:IQCH protein [Climacteris rufus]
QQLEMDIKIMLDPENMDSKADLKHPKDETRLPLITKKKSAPVSSLHYFMGFLYALLCTVTLEYKRIVQQCHLLVGALSLTGQRLILPAAKTTLAAPPVVSKAAPLHGFPRQHKKSAGVYGTYSSGKGSTAPLPCSSVVSSRKAKPEWTHPAQQLESEVQIPTQTQDLCLDWDIAVHRGTVEQKAPAVLALKHHHPSGWGSIVGFLEHTAKLLKDRAVPLATISCSKLAQVASNFDLPEIPTQSEILSVIKNHSAVEKLINRRGQSCRGRGGSAEAAAELAGPRWQQQQRAAGASGAAWRAPLAPVANSPGEARHRHLQNFYTRAKHLAANWNRIRTSRRTIIHIPSLGYSQRIREHSPDLALQQNVQMGRLCDILDANVDVIYICPLPLSEELLSYYHKLLGLQAAVRSGNPEDMGDLQDRFKILTPEAINSFPEHHMCLATVLKYSPKTMQRIQVLTQGREAYVVGGVPHEDDLAVADMLGVPVLGPEPAVAQLYSTKSGSKRIFASAGVPTPPGEWDIRSEEQLLRALGQLVLEHSHVQRWLLKVDDEHAGDGTAYCDVIAHLQCYPWIQQERQRHGPEVWSHSQARELALVKISQELPGLLAQHVQPVNEKRFPTWEKFLQTFLTQGGVVEAFPVSGSISNLTVDVLIEPTGEVSVLSCGEQLHAEGPLRASGSTIPQRAVDPEVLQVLCLKIGEACKSKGVLGYFSVDFVAFIHPQTREQQVWATDLDLCYSDQLAQTQLLLYLTDGNLDCGSSRLQGPLGSRESKNQGRILCCFLQPAPGSSLCAVASSQLRHSSLSGISYNLLLHTCQARGVGFDLQEKQGTVFLLYEDQERDRLGMLTIGEDLQGVLLTFARNLFIIHQEISAPNMQGETNFKMAIQDIEAILGVTAENKLKWEEEQPWEADALKE